MKNVIKSLLLSILIVILSISNISLADETDFSTSGVIDNNGYFSEGVLGHLREINENYLSKDEKSRIGIIIVDSLDGEDISNYIDSKLNELSLYEEYSKNGILMLVSTEDKIFDIKVGDELSEYIDDERCGYIEEEFRNYFELENFDYALTYLIDRASLYLDIFYDYEFYMTEYMYSNEYWENYGKYNVVEDDSSEYWAFIVFLVFAILSILGFELVNKINFNKNKIKNVLNQEKNNESISDDKRGNLYINNVMDLEINLEDTGKAVAPFNNNEVIDVEFIDSFNSLDINKIPNSILNNELIYERITNPGGLNELSEIDEYLLSKTNNTNK